MLTGVASSPAEGVVVSADLLVSLNFQLEIHFDGCIRRVYHADNSQLMLWLAATANNRTYAN